jgi:small-conductance mechanosensitive channel
MDRQQGIYLAIFEAFEKEGIEFAYPTQELLVKMENAVEVQQHTN